MFVKMQEIKDKYKAIVALPRLWLWLATLIIILLVASVVGKFIISAIDNASLAAAVQNSNNDKVKILLEYGVDPNGTVSHLSQNLTYLEYAAQVGNVQLAEILLDHGVNPNVAGINTPLTRAVEGNQPSVVQLLLERGAKIPKPTSNAPNLLHLAAEHGYIVTAQLLLEYGADIEAPFPNGLRPLEYAVNTNKLDLVRLFLKRQADYMAIMRRALTAKDTNILARLLDGGLSPDTKMDDQPLLEWAVRNNFVELVGILIKHGANPNLVAQEGQTLLALAVALDLPEVVGALVDHGADINTKVTTPVSDVFVNLFTTKYEKFYLTKDSGLTPIMLAILRKRQDTVRTLLARKASLDIPTKKYRIWPLGLAANKKDIEMMQILLGRDPNPEKQERHILVSLSKQTATLYVNGEVAINTRVSTGRKGYSTPPGKYVITNKYKKWISSIYDVPMPYFMRLNASAIGLHQGVVPRGPASHGCIRVPRGTVARLFASTQVGDLVTIAQ